MRNIQFWKYQGCGNDFLLMDEKEDMNYYLLAKNICDRNFGIGGDGLILVKEQPLRMRIINHDGSEATMCGNGIRCFVRYLLEQKKYTNKEFQILTKAGLMRGYVVATTPHHIQIDMGEPSFAQDKTGVTCVSPILNYSFYMHYHLYTITTMFIGTIHTILVVSNVEDTQLIKIGKALHQHSLFKKQTNVNFVEVVDHHTIKVRTYEKGVGMTLACGSGACASAYYAYQTKLCENPIKVLLVKGELFIEILNNHVLMSGPAQYIGKGEYQFKEDDEHGC